MTTISRHSIEEAYSLFHQKWKIYSQSDNERQKDDIEYAIAEYARSMNPELYSRLSEGNDDFMLSHSTFGVDISRAVDDLEGMLK